MRRLPVLAVLFILAPASGCAFFPGEGGRVTEHTTVPELLLAADSPRFLVCGHRGDLFGSTFREGHNTVASFERAHLAGADLIEADVAGTPSGQSLVLSHSDPGDPSDESLAEALAWADGRVVLVLDLKADDIARVVREVRRAGAADRVIFYVNRPGEYGKLRAEDRRLHVMVRAKCAADVDRWLARNDPRIVLIHADCEWLDPETLGRIHASGKRVFVNSYLETWHREVFGAESSVAVVFMAGIDVAQTNAPASAARTRDSFRYDSDGRSAGGEP